MSASASPAMPAFSYAQAARGLAPSKEKDQANEQSPKIESKPESVTSQPSSHTSKSRARVEEKEADNLNKDIPQPPIVPDGISDKENLPTSKLPAPKPDSIPSSTASPNVTAALSSPKGKEVAQRLDRSDSWEKDSHTSITLDDEGSTTLREKSKESEDDWDKVSVPSVGGDKDKLKPAPMPTVNPWTLRQQARDLASQRPAVNNQPASVKRPKAVVEGAQSGSTSRDSIPKEESSKHRFIDATRSHGEHLSTCSDGLKLISNADRIEAAQAQASQPQSQPDDKATRRTVADASSWPTPESATTDDRRKSSLQERSEGRSNGAKSHGKQWVTMPFVPTAKFETQLPPSAARRGARSGRGRGDGMSRGGHSHAPQPSDRQEASNAMPPPPVPRQGNDQDRGRKNDASRGGRSTSLPTNNRRATSRESAVTGARKAPGQPTPDTNVTSGASPRVPAPDTEPHQRRSNYDSQTPSRSSSGHGRGGRLPNGDMSASFAESTADPFTMSTQEATSRSSFAHDRNKPPFRQSSDHQGRERGPPRNRDWSRDKSDAAREKVESWRDREYSNETNSYRREPRSERGRGSYRARGTPHLSYQSATTHAYTAPLPQNGFENARPSNVAEPRSRQSSQPFPLPSQVPSNRTNPRSQSIPVGMYPPYYNSVPGMSQGLSSLQTDMSAYGYPAQMPMPGIMSAMPYDPLNSFAVLSMVMTQIEYYFSIDNLCKDLFLRKNMDSQGWVPLSVIANFKRIKTLTNDSMSFDTLRHVCQQVKSVEYLHSEDGDDRLRRRENWQGFVLPMSDRFQTAQHDGPVAKPQPTPQLTHTIPNMGHNEGIPIIPQQTRSPSSTVPAMNGTYDPASAPPYAPIPSLDGQPNEFGLQKITSFHPSQELSRRESTTSPLSQADTSARPSLSSAAHSKSPVGMTNGHRRQVSRNFNEENVFPDDAIESINICVREPLPDASGMEPAPMGGMSRVLSNESLNADVPAVSIPGRITGLRGGAASPEQ